MVTYKVRNKLDDTFWSNTDGWVDFEAATVFQQRDLDWVRLPADGEWIVVQLKETAMSYDELRAVVEETRVRLSAMCDELLREQQQILQAMSAVNLILDKLQIR